MYGYAADAVTSTETGLYAGGRIRIFTRDLKVNHLILHKFSANDFTLVHNQFIEQYMVSANGEFVKIYLYLLHCSATDRDISLSSIADTFNHTENDVKRALSYWEKLHLLSLTYDDEGILTDIAFTDESFSENRQKRLERYADRLEQAIPAHSAGPDSPMEPNRTKAAGRSTAVSQSSESSTFPARFTVSLQRKKELSQQEEVQQLLYIAEQYLAKTLSSTEVNHILYFYDELHFSFDLIEYLIEYCVSKGKRSINYIRKVALEWAAQGITTVSQAKKDTNLYHRDYYTVLNAFGIQGRGPAQAEIEQMSRWFREYGFSTDVVLEACRRTINRTHTPNFQYADKILSGWKDMGVHSLADIEKLDKPAPKASSQEEAAAAPNPKATSNKFNNFPQRKYDFDQLEQQLLDC